MDIEASGSTKLQARATSCVTLGAHDLCLAFMTCVAALATTIAVVASHGRRVVHYLYTPQIDGVIMRLVQSSHPTAARDLRDHQNLQRSDTRVPNEYILTHDGMAGYLLDDGDL